MTREIKIVPVLNGFICHVGCQRVVFTSAKQMLGELGKYYANPDGVEKRFKTSAINKVLGEEMSVPVSFAAEPNTGPVYTDSRLAGQ